MHRSLMAITVLLFTLAVIRQCSCTKNIPLNGFVQHYEPLVMKPEEVSRVRRSVEETRNEIVSLNFKAFGRSFHMRLRPDTNTFTNDAVIQKANGEALQFNRKSLFVGELNGEPNSFVHGSLVNGQFEGKIGTERGDFFVESSSKFFDTPRSFPSVIYRGEDVKYDVKYPDINQRMPQPDIDDSAETKTHRSRRATNDEMKKSDCLLWIGSDHTFTNHYGSYEAAIREIADHVQAASIIYKKAFDKPGLYQGYGLGFRVKKLVVYTDKDPAPGLKETNIGVDTYLDILSKQDFSKYCAAFMFAKRDFDGGILGLAWIGYPSGKAGGICSSFSKFSKGKRTYNTGLVTFNLYKKFVPRRISEITFAHELGHGFGSQHDPDDNKECVPGSKVGNYIMYAQATSGNKDNNNLFSKCSIDEIMANVDAKRSSYSYKECFSDANTPICGNKVIEDGETCDCGDENTCTELCCKPRSLTGDGTGDCQLKTGSECSPSQGPCCNNATCKFSGNSQCRESGECNQATICSPNDVKCPAATHLESYTTVCNDGLSVCVSGECNGSMCLKHSLEECPCTTEDGLCNVCCKDKNSGDQCKLINEHNTTPDKKLTQPPGSPCNSYKGYCDAYAVCREINKQGPLQRLYAKVTSLEGIKEITAQYWYVILLGVIVFIVFVAVLIKVCTVYTPSSNPEKEAKRPHKPIRKRRAPLPENIEM